MIDEVHLSCAAAAANACSNRLPPLCIQPHPPLPHLLQDKAGLLCLAVLAEPSHQASERESQRAVAARQHSVENPQTQVEVARFAAPVEEDAVGGRARHGAILELHLDQRPMCLVDLAGVTEALDQDVVARVVRCQLPLAHVGDQTPNAAGIPACRARAHQHAVVRHIGLAVSVLHVKQELLGVIVPPGVTEPLH